MRIHEHHSLFLYILVVVVGADEAYFGTPIDPEVLAAKYDCPADLRPWYGNFSGPCCRPKYM